MYMGYQIHEKVTSEICYVFKIHANVLEYNVSRINYI